MRTKDKAKPFWKGWKCNRVGSKGAQEKSGKSKKVGKNGKEVDKIQKRKEETDKIQKSRKRREKQVKIWKGRESEKKQQSKTQSTLLPNSVMRAHGTRRLAQEASSSIKCCISTPLTSLVNHTFELELQLLRLWETCPCFFSRHR